MYQMFDIEQLYNNDDNSLDKCVPKTIIVKKMSLNFNEKQSTVINLTDVSAFYQLKQKEDANNLLETLIASVHHEMVVPLKVNVEMAERLIINLAGMPAEKKLAENILIASNIVLMHAHDFIDQRLIEKGSFVPYLQMLNLETTIKETVKIIEVSLIDRNLKILCMVEGLKEHPKIRFDKRRFQQVLLNLLSNATKYQSEGVI